MSLDESVQRGTPFWAKLMLAGFMFAASFGGWYAVQSTRRAEKEVFSIGMGEGKEFLSGRRYSLYKITFMDDSKVNVKDYEPGFTHYKAGDVYEVDGHNRILRRIKEGIER